MYQERMKGYYPPVIQTISEFQAIIDSEYPEIEELSNGKDRVIADAYWLTMSEDRIKQWEAILGIRIVEGSSLEDRRDTIMARLRGQGKLNTSLINTIVKTFTGGECKAWINGSVLYIRLAPSNSDKTYLLDNLTQEISIKLPAHLTYDIKESWQYWMEINSSNPNWNDVKRVYSTWENVLFNRPASGNALNTSKLDEFFLG
jgi:hypothetical protein